MRQKEEEPKRTQCNRCLWWIDDYDVSYYNVEWGTICAWCQDDLEQEGES